MQSHADLCNLMQSHAGNGLNCAHTFMNSCMVVGGYFFWGPWMMALSRGHTNQAIE